MRLLSGSRSHRQEVPQLWAYRQLLPDLVQKLHVCARQELIPLLEIDCVKRSRAQQLYDGGFKTVGAVSRAEPEQLCRVVKFLSKQQAQRIVNSAKVIFRDLVAEKAEELELIGAIQDKEEPELGAKSLTPRRLRPLQQNSPSLTRDTC